VGDISELEWVLSIILMSSIYSCQDLLPTKTFFLPRPSSYQDLLPTKTFFLPRPSSYQDLPNQDLLPTKTFSYQDLRPTKTFLPNYTQEYFEIAVFSVKFHFRGVHTIYVCSDLLYLISVLKVI
jgi:hypothetical protein